ncbi:uncharacterized protein K441DRAFT_592372, partial [Cenococcum geophilum 1.58]
KVIRTSINYPNILSYVLPLSRGKTDLYNVLYSLLGLYRFRYRSPKVNTKDNCLYRRLLVPLESSNIFLKCTCFKDFNLYI